VSASAQRARALEALERGPFDVLIIGGGIVGTGIARDLALRGLKVALVERDDLASGTSSRPTRLIHGGLRYLEMFDFGLVRTDMREREVLLHLAPHLVQPLQFLMPMYGRGVLYRAKLQAGMQLYDALSFDKSLPTRQWLNKRQVLRVEPGLEPVGLQGAWQFGGVRGARVADRLSGQTLEVRARLTVNATGPWLDLTTTAVRPGAPPLLRLTKGVHLVTPAATRKAHVLFARRDGRLFFVIPWLGYSLVGTTDTDYTGDPAEAAATEPEVEYLVEEARRVFPGGPFDQIYYTYAGVRALVRIDRVSEGKVSRKHALHDHARRDGVPGLVSVVGGKITGYRAIAEEVGDLVARKLGLSKQRTRGSITDSQPLPGGHVTDMDSYVERELWPRASALGLDRDQTVHLTCIYGSRAPDLLARVERNPRLAERVCPGEPTIAAQLEHAVEAEWALTLGDVLLRRTGLGLRACQGLDCLDRVVEHVARALEWSPEERRRQVDAYRRELEPMRRFSTEPSAAAV
jgi:glycerol-3-phosphate dehydrogenase